MKKYAVYLGTRNLYLDMIVAAKSLVANSSIDEIFFITEDDVFPVDVPDIITNINMSKQDIFKKNSPNFKTRFAYLCLLRSCYSRYLPDYACKDLLLQLDVDTIIVDNIDPLFELPMNEKYISCTVEDLGGYNPDKVKHYFNVGVALLNMKTITRDQVEDTLVNILNTRRMACIDQDAWNYYIDQFCGWDYFEPMPIEYNETFVTGYTEEPKIIHFCGHKNWQNGQDVPRREYIKKYRGMSWDEVFKLHELRCNNG